MVRLPTTITNAIRRSGITTMPRSEPRSGKSHAAEALVSGSPARVYVSSELTRAKWPRGVAGGDVAFNALILTVQSARLSSSYRQSFIRSRSSLHARATRLTRRPTSFSPFNRTGRTNREVGHHEKIAFTVVCAPCVARNIGHCAHDLLGRGIESKRGRRRDGRSSAHSKPDQATG